MSLVFSAITPHPPILIPQIGKENLDKLQATVQSYKILANELEKSATDTVIIISPHGEVQADAFTMNLNPIFKCNFEAFGDFSTKRIWDGNIGLAYKIRERMETRAPLQLVSEEDLDHGASVPLYLLTQNLPKIKVIPLYYSGLNNEAHFKFGELLKREIFYNKENIAVIASGDLSHRLSEDAPAGYSPEGKVFDKKIVDLLSHNKSKEIINLNQKMVHEAGECGLKSFIIQQGIMEGVTHKPKLLSYEAPFGVGYLTMNFEL